MADDPYKYFRIEARELVESLGKGVLELEKGASPDVVGRILRHAHTLKGAARVVRQTAIADRAHSIEDLLAPLRDTETRPDAARVTSMLNLIDDIATQLAAIALPGEPVSAVPIRDEIPLVVRAELGEMDALLDGLLETNARIGALREPTQQLDKAQKLVDVLAAFGSDTTARDLEKRQAVIEELRNVVRRSHRELNVGLDHASRELAQVRETAEQLRLIPVASVFTMLERTARDAAQALSKQVTFEARGGEVRLDAHVVAVIQGALVQLVRNAVAHGIEGERERLAARKPSAGRVVIDVARRGKRALFTCRDDGRGLDLDAIRRAAKARGSTVPETADAAALLSLLLRGGITTTSKVTEVAGRGIGLDVLRVAVEKLGGEVRIETSPNLGTTFEINVPVSLASVEALVVDAAGANAALPLDAVRACRRLMESEVSRTAHSENVMHGGAMIPIVRLASLLRRERAARHRGTCVAIVVEAGGRLAAVAVDRVLGTMPVIVRSVPESVGVDRIVVGAAFDPLGNPELVLDPEELVAAAHRERVIELPEARRATSVLVIDDSVTTRMLEQSILESAGYHVDTAVSGEEGLDAARRKRYALFLVDVEMPGIDGFTFVERIRADANLKDIPAILVTSRSAAADRMRGEQVGAQGYIVKSEFDQADLLARIEHLVRAHA